MGWQEKFAEWSALVLQNRDGFGAVFLESRNRVGAHGRAHDLAEEAVQEALARAAEIGDTVEKLKNNFDFFCNWVMRFAISHARATLRRERQGRPPAERRARVERGALPGEEWADRVRREGIGLGAVALQCENRDAAPEQALALAEEAIEEALASAAKVIDKVKKLQDDFGFFRNWITRVAINHVRDTLRRERGRQLEEGEDAEIPQPAGPPGDVEFVREFLETLPEDQRNLLLLYYGPEKVTLNELGERFEPSKPTRTAREQAAWKKKEGLLDRLRKWLE